MTGERWPRIRRWVALGWTALLLGGLVLLSLVLAISFIPVWYAPPVVAESDLPRIRATVPQTYQSFTDRIVSGGRFAFDLPAADLNEWIAARDALWPDARGAVPEMLHEPIIAFHRHRIILAARITDGSSNAVVSARFAVIASSAAIEIRLVGISLGALPLPLAALPADLERRAHGWLERVRLLAGPPSGHGVEHDSLPHSRNDGILFPNRFHWSNGRRDFKIVDLAPRDGVLALTVESR